MCLKPQIYVHLTNIDRENVGLVLSDLSANYYYKMKLNIKTGCMYKNIDIEVEWTVDWREIDVNFRRACTSRKRDN